MLFNSQEQRPHPARCLIVVKARATKISRFRGDPFAWICLRDIAEALINTVHWTPSAIARRLCVWSIYHNQGPAAPNPLQRIAHAAISPPVVHEKARTVMTARCCEALQRGRATGPHRSPLIKAPPAPPPPPPAADDRHIVRSSTRDYASAEQHAHTKDQVSDASMILRLLHRCRVTSRRF